MSTHITAGEQQYGAMILMLELHLSAPHEPILLPPTCPINLPEHGRQLPEQPHAQC